MVWRADDRKAVIAQFVKRGSFLRTILLVSISILILPRISAAGGPWKGQVVDAETKQPVDAVIVIAVWSTLQAGGTVVLGYVDSEEVLTGEDGKFNIPAKKFTWEPRLYLFKPGMETGGSRERTSGRNLILLKDVNATWKRTRNSRQTASRSNWFLSNHA